ncbi:hypothetical protein BL253_29030 [Pseudofrankia asymbiotica]|uniref:Uncharacterized protein n=1 Tax=Pseudofrankia asymbiotica TaxID=1834516 RepID=A0A1V2I5H6_9ACTN|nr:hypothetical protein BL253_29030 [Pseudofrankia asymbiotica]
MSPDRLSGGVLSWWSQATVAGVTRPDDDGVDGVPFGAVDRHRTRHAVGAFDRHRWSRGRFDPTLDMYGLPGGSALARRVSMDRGVLSPYTWKAEGRERPLFTTVRGRYQR